MAMTDRPPPRCRLSSAALGVSCEVSVGETVKLGRAADNDLVCEDPSVAQYHARAVWGPDLALPVLRNNVGPEALKIDGVRVLQMAPLRDGARLELGAVELLVELLGLVGEEGQQEALLEAFATRGEAAARVTLQVREFMRPRPVTAYELAAPSVEDCLAALGRVVSRAEAEAVLAQACETAGFAQEALDDVENLERVVEVLRGSGGVIQMAALSLSIRLASYRCLAAKVAAS